jgi:hypothetical protein
LAPRPLTRPEIEWLKHDKKETGEFARNWFKEHPLTPKQ